MVSENTSVLNHFINSAKNETPLTWVAVEHQTKLQMPIAAEKTQRQNTYSKAPQQRDKIHTVELYNKVPMKRILDAAKHVIEINNITIKLNRMQSINVTPKNKSLNLLAGA